MCNKEGVALHDDEAALDYLSKQELITFNNLFPSSQKKVSVFVLRDSPYLLRHLKQLAAKS
ncbi:hypothetical protein [Oceanobacillus halotolerans]|uniref:hypothetical protein n=1 Tax=Oceanobacillus halotolerans TaxID=2663380 RepID=UPI0013DA3C3D|nr:hypothetical protein [Oceanobacillus halotolerans]